MGFGFGGMPE